MSGNFVHRCGQKERMMDKTSSNLSTCVDNPAANVREYKQY